jgi:AraC-like DNA-binding protein
VASFERATSVARAFRAWTGESPAAYRQRWLTGTYADR